MGLAAGPSEQLLPLLRYAPWPPVGGLLLSLAVGFCPLLWGQPLFTHRPAPGEHVVTIGSVELFTPSLYDVGIVRLVVGVLMVLLHQFADPDSRVEDPADDHSADGKVPRTTVRGKDRLTVIIVTDGWWRAAGGAEDRRTRRWQPLI